MNTAVVNLKIVKVIFRFKLIDFEFYDVMRKYFVKNYK